MKVCEWRGLERVEAAEVFPTLTAVLAVVTRMTLALSEDTSSVSMAPIHAALGQLLHDSPISGLWLWGTGVKCLKGRKRFNHL